MRWVLTGTENQKRIAAGAFDRIYFPFDQLAQLPGTPELGWRDLNSGAFRIHGDHAHDTGETGEDRADPLVGEIEGRKWVMGIIYTQSGRIYLDYKLEADPELAQAVVAAEIAHAVDFFLPMTDAQRNELLELWGVPGTTWWEKFDYGAEYFTLGGEAFMHEFVTAYTDLNFGDKSSFAHDAGVEPEDVRRIVGIGRTDEPLPFVNYGTSNVYHKVTHRVRSKYAPQYLMTLDGFRPCKVCKP